MANNTVAIGLKMVFSALGLAMVVTLVYTISTDGLPFRKDLLTSWMVATLVDFYINVVVLAAWILYKESSWTSVILWTILLVCLGSITTCIYIVVQLFKLSPQESAQDPIYHVLLRHPNKNNVEEKMRHSPVITARISFGALGCLMFGTLLYTLLTDGSPFRKELFTPWMVATLIDFYINVIALSVWIAYKESSLIGAVFWIILMICFGSLTTCVYIVRQLFLLTSQDPLYLVLFKIGDSTERRYERPVF